VAPEIQSPDSRVSLSDSIGGLELQHEEFLKSQAELEAVFQGYYTAVEMGDFDEALTYYSWEPLGKHSARQWAIPTVYPHLANH